jgi:hypothetical protein
LEKKEMQQLREQRGEQATEIQITAIETEQQQEQKNKDDKKREEIAKPILYALHFELHSPQLHGPRLGGGSV